MSTAVLVREAFEVNGLKYKEFNEMPDGNTVMVAGFAGKMTNFDMLLIFDKQDHTMVIRVGKLARIPIDRKYDVLTALNDLNRNYRWARFYADDEELVTVQIDRIISTGENADAVMELIFRLLRILDDGYPRIMKAIWA